MDPATRKNKRDKWIAIAINSLARDTTDELYDLCLNSDEEVDPEEWEEVTDELLSKLEGMFADQPWCKAEEEEPEEELHCLDLTALEEELSDGPDNSSMEVIPHSSLQSTQVLSSSDPIFKPEVLSLIKLSEMRSEPAQDSHKEQHTTHFKPGLGQRQGHLHKSGHWKRSAATDQGQQVDGRKLSDVFKPFKAPRKDN